MARPETLATHGGPDLFAKEDSRPIEGKSFENVQRFLSEGAVAEVRREEEQDYSNGKIYYPSANGATLQYWERNLGMVYGWAFSKDSLRETAMRQGLDPSVTYRTLRNTVAALWDQAPEEIKAGFPLESFGFRKSDGKKSGPKPKPSPRRMQHLPYPERLAQKGGPNLFGEQDSTHKILGYSSWDNTISFLAELAFFEPRSDYVPPEKQNKRRLANHNRLLEIVGEIFGGNYDNPLADVARKENLTRERTRQIAERVLDELYEIAPAELAERYPRDLLSTNRQTSIGYGIRGQILVGIEEGLSAQELNQRFGSSNLSIARKRLNSVGIEVPRVPNNRITERFSGLSDPNKTDAETQALLNEITNHGQVEVLKAAGFVVGLTDLAVEASLHLFSSQIHFIGDSLLKGDPQLPQIKLPHITKGKDGSKLATSTYRLIAKMHEPRAIEVLNNDHSLDRFRINPTE